MQRKSTQLLVFILLAAVVCFGALFISKTKQRSQPASEDKLKVKDFNSQGVCTALMPSCGYCPGEEKDGNCYLVQSEFDEYKKQHSDLKVSQ